MKDLTTLYNDSLATLTDLYQLTMAYGYWKNNIHEKNAVFHLFYRKEPFDGNYAILAGVETVVHFLKNFRYRPDDLDYLLTLTGPDGSRLFDLDFIEYLQNMEFCCTVDTIAEGTVVFANEPLLRITGPIIQCQLLETILLNIINFQTLIATKASRVCAAADGDKVVEFGLRRAQGIDGGLSASRACYIGGCSATSNVLAGKLFGIPVIGTHAHSWVMSFNSEEESFEAYAQTMPNNCVFLVDTFDTLEGVKKAIIQGIKLRERGYEMTGIRLDSGDLCQLSIQARKLLDEAGFPKAIIVASNDLDEYKIAQLKEAGARIDSWGVGTQMITSADQSALGGVYKLGAIEDQPGRWIEKIKLSNDIEKVTNPGVLEVWRYYSRDDGSGFQDIVVNTDTYPTSSSTLEYVDHAKRLLQPLFHKGVFVGKIRSISEVRKFVLEQMENFDLTVEHKVIVDETLMARKKRMISRTKVLET